MSSRIRRDVEVQPARSVFENVPAARMEAVRARGAIGAREEMLRECEVAREAARAEGFKQGFDEGRSEGAQLALEEGRLLAKAQFQVDLDEEVALFRQEFSATLAQVPTAVDAFFQSTERQLAKICAQVVERILRKELEISDEALLGIVRAAIDEVTLSRQVRVRLNPFDAHTLRKHRDRVIAGLASLEQLEIIEDPSVVDGCIVESDHGSVDATLPTILHQVQEAA